MARDVPNPDRDPGASTDARSDAEVRRDEDIVYDDWPIEGYDESDHTATQFLGTTQATSSGGTVALVYDDEEREIFEATVDETERRLVPRPESEREVGPSETLGEVLEDVGDSLGVASLSEFAEEHLQDRDQESETVTTAVAEADDRTVVDAEVASFTRSNVSERANHDLEFSGSVTYRPTDEADDQAYIVERDFVVSYDDANDPGEAMVDVTERLLRAEAPKETRRDGDAEPLEENATTFAIDLESAETDRAERIVEERCREWHESRLEPIS